MSFHLQEARKRGVSITSGTDCSSTAVVLHLMETPSLLVGPKSVWRAQVRQLGKRGLSEFYFVLRWVTVLRVLCTVLIAIGSDLMPLQAYGLLSEEWNDKCTRLVSTRRKTKRGR